MLYAAVSSPGVTVGGRQGRRGRDVRLGCIYVVLAYLLCRVYPRSLVTFRYLEIVPYLQRRVWGQVGGRRPVLTRLCMRHPPPHTCRWCGDQASQANGHHPAPTNDDDAVLLAAPGRNALPAAALQSAAAGLRNAPVGLFVGVRVGVEQG